MTIVFLARRFYPQIGGVEKHVLEVGKRLVKKGHKVIVITELEKNTNGQNYHSVSKSARLTGKVAGIEIFRINAGANDWFKKFRVWKQLWKLKKIIISADIVHCHDVFFWYLPFRFLYPTKKVFTTFHGYEGNSMPTKKAILMHKLAEKLSHGNICVGDFLKKWYGTRPTFITYGAVDKKLIAQGSKSQKPTKDAIFIGRLEEEAGILEYLKVLTILKGRHMSLSLDVYGDGVLKDESLNYSKSHNLKVNFKGFVNSASDYIKNYEYVFCSRYLGMLEAMALQKPVFTQYNNEIKKDYLQMAPFAKYISITSDAALISNAVENYMGKKNLEVARAYLWVKNETWEKMVNLYLRLWNRA
ncbi:MAG TPA: glycosyltransferase family 4 protein [Patescibacteria group bacterium]|jgi:glycosyltransferase involved in cell wall biosynthesis|nr:glycosyltransferase family 4 protein [Patescibacteria group bacterium]